MCICLYDHLLRQVCYISEDHWRRHGRRPGDIKVSLCLAADKVFGIPRYAETIEVRRGLRGWKMCWRLMLLSCARTLADEMTECGCMAVAALTSDRSAALRLSTLRCRTTDPHHRKHTHNT